MTSRPARPSWGSLAVVAPGSLAFLAAAVMWVSAHDPRAADQPQADVGSSTAGPTVVSSGATGPGDENRLGPDSATSLRLARLQILLERAEAQLVLLDKGGAASPVQAPRPVPAGAPPPAAQPSSAPSPAPVAHATTGASGA